MSGQRLAIGQDPQQRKQFRPTLNFINALYTITEVMLFARALAYRNVLEPAANIGIELHGMEGRRLTAPESIPFRGSYVAQTDTIRAAAIVAAIAATGLSLAQRALSTPARTLRRRVTTVEGTMMHADGTATPITHALLLAPLEFTLVDTWRSHALGGCTLRVSHGGGRAYSTFPVNANEAESRRQALFVPHGHAHGPVDVSRFVKMEDPDYPFTLDLRRSTLAV